MTQDEILEHLQQPYRECVVLDGLDDALIGYLDNGHEQPRALYDLEKCVEIIVAKLGWTFANADGVIRRALIDGWVPAAGMPAFAVLKDTPGPPSTFTCRIEDSK